MACLAECNGPENAPQNLNMRFAYTQGRRWSRSLRTPAVPVIAALSGAQRSNEVQSGPGQHKVQNKVQNQSYGSRCGWLLRYNYFRIIGANGEGRTPMTLRPLDPKSSASASSATFAPAGATNPG